MRGAITAVLNAIIRIFFRRLEVSGREHLPAGPVILVANHPNALFDPLVLLCRVGRPVSFLAKEPLFRTPVIGWFVRALDSIPVYRQMDQADTRRNQATFAAARDVLARGGSIAVFPEGTSHSDPRLKPFRTGAARIALGAASGGVIQIVPAGLFYTEKTRFRSSALLCFGPPLVVPAAPLAPDGQPPVREVRDLTAALEDALGALTLQADHLEALRLVESAERIISTASPEGSQGLPERLQIRQRLLAGYSRMRKEAPERLDAIVSQIARHAASLEDAHVTPELLPATGYRTWTVLRITILSLSRLLVLLPLAVVGMILHAPAWLATDLIAGRITRDSPDMVATVKALGGVLFYLLTWIAIAAVAGVGWGIWWGVVAVAAGPLTGFAALRFRERLDRLIGGARGLALALSGQRRFLRLVAERRAIRDELARLGDEFGV